MGLGFAEEAFNHVPGIYLQRLGKVDNIKMDLIWGKIPMSCKIKSQSSLRLSLKPMIKESGTPSDGLSGSVVDADGN